MNKPLFLVLCCVYFLPASATEMLATQPQRVAQISVNESQAIQIALRDVPGKVLSAQLSDDGGRKVYRVKILSNDGRVRTVNVDAESGRII